MEEFVCLYDLLRICVSWVDFRCWDRLVLERNGWTRGTNEKVCKVFLVLFLNSWNASATLFDTRERNWRLDTAKLLFLEKNCRLESWSRIDWKELRATMLEIRLTHFFVDGKLSYVNVMFLLIEVEFKDKVSRLVNTVRWIKSLFSLIFKHFEQLVVAMFTQMAGRQGHEECSLETWTHRRERILFLNANRWHFEYWTRVCAW